MDFRLLVTDCDLLQLQDFDKIFPFVSRSDFYEGNMANLIYNRIYVETSNIFCCPNQTLVARGST